MQTMSDVQGQSAPPTQRAVAVVARDLRKQYKDFEAVKGINFQVYQQECFGLLGPNGAGKSTTIRMMHCNSPITSGTLEVLGHSVVSKVREIKAELGVVPQDDNLDGDLTVIQNLLVYARYFNITGKEAQKRAEEALELFQLTEKAKSRIEEISGGMKRRLVIARALINNPRLIILDEPTTGLDPAARQLVWQKLRYLRESGVTLILTTHYMDEAAQLCDRIIIMNEGQILAEGTPQSLVERFVGYEVVEMRLNEADRESLKNSVGNRPVTVEDVGDTVFLFGKERGVFDNWHLPDGHYKFRRLASLEDVFLRLTGRGLNEG